MARVTKFPGQVLSVWLQKEADRKRLTKVIEKKYKRQLGFSSYAKLAIYKQLEEDEASTEGQEDKKEGGQGARGGNHEREADENVNLRVRGFPRRMNDTSATAEVGASNE